MCDPFGPPTFARPYQKYEVYKKRPYVYVFGIDKVDREYSLLKIHIAKKEDPSEKLELEDGKHTYPIAQLDNHKMALLTGDPNLYKAVAFSQGRRVEVKAASGLVGFIRFVQGHYLIVITKHRKCGKIGHHYVLCIEDTMLVPLFEDSVNGDEKRFREHFSNFNLGKDFYFSYSYELSRTVQQNLADAMRARASGSPERRPARRPLYTEQNPSKHHRFVWNHYHMGPFLRDEDWQRWCLPLIHGFFAYSKCSSFGWTFEVALIARRSRCFAGTRYRKRGLNVDGQVANHVETEQLLCDDCTRHLSHGHVMSFVQIRGSVPLFWSQEAVAINPKPPVVYPRCDPTLSATRLHFADLLERYGTPQLVVNLMRTKKIEAPEVRLNKHFESAIERMNRELPANKRILYKSFDVKNYAKSNSIFDYFSRLAESVVSRVGFLHTSQGVYGKPEKIQNGVVRTNCVDCLDRTNVLQFFVGLEVLKHQLTELKLLPEPRLDFDSQVVSVLSELYDLMGDHLALQYAGSVAHKKYQLLGCRPTMMPTTRELLTSIHRHYSNSFGDAEKQASMNLFLGIYQPLKHPRLWEMDSDSWVHHRLLRNDYNPGDWWEAPLKVYFQNTAVLCGLGPVLPSLPPKDEESGWFRVIHSVWKFTWFEKLLSRLEATLLQINSSNRSSRRCGMFGEIPQRFRPQPKRLRSSDDQPPVVNLSDLEKYRSYADLRQLSRLMWKMVPKDSNPVDDLVRVKFPQFSRVEVFCPVVLHKPSQAMLDRLARLIVVHMNCLRPTQRSRAGQNDKIEHQKAAAQRQSIDKIQELRVCRSRYDELQKFLQPQTDDLATSAFRKLSYNDPTMTQQVMPQERLWGPVAGAHTPGSERKLEPASFSSVPHNLHLLSSSIKPSVSAPVLAAAHSPPSSALSTTGSAAGNGTVAPVKLRLCSYCGRSFDVRAQEDEPLADVLESAPLKTIHGLHGPDLYSFCPHHRRRARELKDFARNGGLWKSQTNSEEAGSRVTEIRVTRTEPSRKKPWEGWLQVEDRSRSSTQLDAGCTHPTPEALSENQPSARKAGTRSLMRPDIAPLLESRSSPGLLTNCPVVVSMPGIGVSRVWEAPGAISGPGIACAEAPVVDRRHTTAGAAAVQLRGQRQPLLLATGTDDNGTAGAKDGDSGSSNQPAKAVAGLEEARWKHLWSYAFPQAPPAAANVEELGLPAWWLKTLEQPAPLPEDHTTLPPNTKKHKNQNKRRSVPSHSHSRTGSMPSSGLASALALEKAAAPPVATSIGVGVEAKPEVYARASRGAGAGEACPISPKRVDMSGHAAAPKADNPRSIFHNLMRQALNSEFSAAETATSPPKEARGLNAGRIARLDDIMPAFSHNRARSSD